MAAEFNATLPILLPMGMIRIVEAIGGGNNTDSDNGNSPWNTDHGGAIFAIYCAYIFISLIIAFLLDKCKVFDRRIHELTIASQDNLLPLIRTKALLDGRTSFEEGHIKLEEQCCDCLCGGKHASSKEMKKYQLEYLEYLISNGPCYYGTRPLTDLQCTNLHLCGKDTKIALAPGLYDDFMLYLYNNHSILSMVTAIKGHPFTRAKRRSIFFCQNCITLGVFVVKELNNGSESVFSLFGDYVFMPLFMLMIGSLLYNMLVCPCFRKHRRQPGCCFYCVRCLETLGWTFLLPFALLCLVYLLIMSFINRGGDIAALNRVATYAYKTHIIAAVEELLLRWTCFLTGRSTINLYVLGFPVWSFGSYFEEKMSFGVETMEIMRPPRKDYCCGLFGYESIVEAEFAEALMQQANKLKEAGQSYVQKVGTDIELGKAKVSEMSSKVTSSLAAVVTKQPSSPQPTEKSAEIDDEERNNLALERKSKEGETVPIPADIQVGDNAVGISKDVAMGDETITFKLSTAIEVDEVVNVLHQKSEE